MLEKLQQEGDLLIIIARRYLIPRLPNGIQDRANLLYFVLARGELDDDFAAIVGVALPVYQPSLLQSGKYPGDRPAGKPCEIGKLTCCHCAAEIQDIHDLDIRDSHPNPGRSCPEEGGAESGEMPKLPRKLPAYIRSFFLRTT